MPENRHWDEYGANLLLLLISMLWHRQAIFESKGDKLSSSAESRIRTQGLRHLFANKLKACWQTDWAIEDQAFLRCVCNICDARKSPLIRIRSKLTGIPTWVSNHINSGMKWLIHSKTSTVQPLKFGSLGIVKSCHPTLYWACDYLSMLGLK